MTQSRAKLEKKIDKLAEKGRYDKAISECQNLLSKFKGDLALRQRLAELQAQSGNDAEAIRTYFKLAKRYEKNEQPQQAARIYNRVLSLDPNHVDARLKLADLALAQGTTHEAIDHLAQAAEHLARQDNIRTCQQVLDRISEIDPDDYEQRLKIAEVFAELDQANAAASEYARVMVTLKRTKRTGEAVEVAKQAVALDITDVEILCELGGVLSELNQWDLAEQVELRIKNFGREASQPPPAEIDIPIDVEEPPAKIASLDLVSDEQTTAEVDVRKKAPSKKKASAKPPEEKDIYSELFGDDDSSD